MEDGARHRGGSEKGSDSPEKTEEGGVALKKEIGLMSACGIIVGEWGLWWDVIFPVCPELDNTIFSYSSNIG